MVLKNDEIQGIELINLLEIDTNIESAEIEYKNEQLSIYSIIGIFSLIGSISIILAIEFYRFGINLAIKEYVYSNGTVVDIYYKGNDDYIRAFWFVDEIHVLIPPFHMIAYEGNDYHKAASIISEKNINQTYPIVFNRANNTLIWEENSVKFDPSMKNFYMAFILFLMLGIVFCVIALFEHIQS